MKNTGEHLTKNRQYLLRGGGGALALLVLLRLFCIPLYDAQSRAERSLKANQRIVKAIIPLGIEYGNLKRSLVQAESILAARPKDFSLPSYLGKKAEEARIRRYIKQINPAKMLVTRPPYAEAVVDLTLENVTLKQLVSFLSLIESPLELVRIKNISIVKSKEKAGYLNATMQIVTFMPARGEGAGKGHPQDNAVIHKKNI